eukprot:scaffold143339_cov133-Phaeocystis_antarctica.AAC.1
MGDDSAVGLIRGARAMATVAAVAARVEAHADAFVANVDAVRVALVQPRQQAIEHVRALSKTLVWVDVRELN